MLDLGALDDDVLADRCVRPDVDIVEPHARSDHGGPPPGRGPYDRARMDDRRALDLGVDQLRALDAGPEALQREAVRAQEAVVAVAARETAADLVLVHARRRGDEGLGERVDGYARV